MLVFYLLLLVPVMIQHFTIKNHPVSYEQKNARALLFFFVLLTMLVMFRHESVGNDTRNYIHYFKNFSQMSWNEVGRTSLEFGFAYFNKFVSLFSKEPQFFLATTAIAVSAMIYPTYQRLCIDASLTIVLFGTMSTFVMMFSGIRQMLAVGIGFIAYQFTREKRLWPFVIAVAIAITVHTSAFMLLFMYPLYHIRVTKKWLYVVVPTVVIVFVFNQQIFGFLATILSRFTRFDASTSSTGAYMMIILFALLTIFAFLIPDEDRMDEETNGLRNFLLLALVLQLFAPVHMLAMRMNYYYIIFIPLLIPKIIFYRRAAWDRIALIARHVMVVFFLLYFFVNAHAGSNLHVFPYHFFWESV